MADEKPPGSPGAKRRRPPTVIDLPATEVPSEPTMTEPQAEAVASPSADPEPVRSEPPQEPPPSPPREEPPPERLSLFAFMPDPSSWSVAGAAGIAGAL